MPIDFTKKKAAPKPSDQIVPAGTAKIPSGFAKKAVVPAAPSDDELKAASQQSPLQHPGDSPVKVPSKAKPAQPVKKTGQGAPKSSKPAAKSTGLVPGIPIELYIRGTARKSVLIDGPEQTIEAFKAFVNKRGVKNWEALQLLIQNEDSEEG